MLVTLARDACDALVGYSFCTLERIGGTPSILIGLASGVGAFGEPYLAPMNKAAAFLRDKKKPTDAEIKTALDGLKCRCGTHVSILKAVKRAAQMMG